MGKILTCFILMLSFSFASDKPFFDEKLLKKVESEYGVFAKERVKKLDSLMQSLKNASEEEKLIKVNDFFNDMRFASDKEVWKKNDYWATRMEFIGKDAGDCEDFVTAKFFTLRQLGIPSKKLYFTYTKAVNYNEAHMVLSYYKTPKSVPLVLDNINKKIFPATKRKDLIPVYSFNGDALYLAKQVGLGRIVPSGNSNNTKWNDLMKRIKKEDK